MLVGGEPAALLAASATLYEVASRTDDTGRRLLGALAPAASTILATAPWAPLQAAAVHRTLADVLLSPAAGLATVAAVFHATSLQLRNAGQALEAAGAVGLLASGGLGLLRGERPTVLASADGVDLRREAVTGSWSVGSIGQTSSLGVREVRRPDGTSIFVVEVTTGVKEATAAGIQVNGVGAFAEAGQGVETTLRWAVATRRDAELLLAMVSAGLVPVVGALVGSRLPKPTETLVAGTAAATAVGGVGPIPGLTTASGAVAVRGEVTTLASGTTRVAASISGGGQLGLLGVTGTGGATTAKVTVDRDPAGVVTKVSVSTTTEVDRGRHGLPLVEAGNREATVIERERSVELTPERRAAADRIAAAVARGEAPDRADIDELAEAVRGAAATERTYDVRRQQSSADVAVGKIAGGGAAGVDTAVLRNP